MKIGLADNQRMSPGTPCFCPKCGTVGRYETSFTVERRPRYNDFVRYNYEIEEFECHECWFR